MKTVLHSWLQLKSIFPISASNGSQPITLFSNSTQHNLTLLPNFVRIQNDSAIPHSDVSSISQRSFIKKNCTALAVWGETDFVLFPDLESIERDHNEIYQEEYENEIQLFYPGMLPIKRHSPDYVEVNDPRYRFDSNNHSKLIFSKPILNSYLPLVDSVVWELIPDRPQRFMIYDRFASEFIAGKRRGFQCRRLYTHFFHANRLKTFRPSNSPPAYCTPLCFLLYRHSEDTILDTIYRQAAFRLRDDSVLLERHRFTVPDPPGVVPRRDFDPDIESELRLDFQPLY